MKIGRNDLCPCGSGKKYKKCCWKRENIDIPNDRYTIKGKLNEIYPLIKDWNSSLLKKANIPDYEGATFHDAIDLTITSNALSLIKNIIIGNQYSATAALNVRDIIECIALLSMEKDGGISDTQMSLFPEQYKLMEYYTYVKNGQLLYEGLANLDELTKSFNEAFEKFSRAGLSGKEIKEISNSRIPFLCDKNINFNKLLQQYFPNMLYGYGLLSRIIHPSSYELPIDTKTYDNIIKIIVNILIDFATKSPQHSSSLTYRQEELAICSWNIDVDDNNPLHLKNLTIKQCDELGKLSNDLIGIFSGKNYLSHFLDIVVETIKDIITDTIVGYTENVKLKFKVIAEIFACFNKTYFSYFDNLTAEYASVMPRQHDICRCYQSLDKEIPTKTKKLVVNTFRNEFNTSSLTEEQIWKSFFKPLGFLMDKDGHTPTYTALVKEYFNNLYKNDKTISRYCNNADILTRDYLYMLYKESNNMSHGCGYLFFANSGAWMDDIAVLQFTDMAILNTTQRLHAIFNILKDEHEKNKLIAQRLNKTLDILNEITLKKFEIYKIPKIAKPI